MLRNQADISFYCPNGFRLHCVYGNKTKRKLFETREITKSGNKVRFCGHLIGFDQTYLEILANYSNRSANCHRVAPRASSVTALRIRTNLVRSSLFDSRICWHLASGHKIWYAIFQNSRDKQIGQVSCQLISFDNSYLV